MIVTVTLNPALDKTAGVDVMRPYALNRLRGVQVDAGGKGVNVSAMIHALGGESVATGFAGGGAGEELLRRLTLKGIRHDFVRVSSVTRTNLKVVDDAGGLTELNEPGPEIKTEEFAQLQEKLAGFAKPGNIFVLSGSLPRGLSSGVYRELCAMLRQSGAGVFLDADGDALEAALDTKLVPDYIKPNRYELLNLFGMEARGAVTEEDLTDLCLRLRGRGVKLVALSLGSEGALFAGRDGVLRSPALPVKVGSTVGAGDSMVGALVYGFEQGLSGEDCCVLAMAASAGACTTEGTNPPSRALVDELVKQVSLQKTS